MIGLLHSCVRGVSEYELESLGTWHLHICEGASVLASVDTAERELAVGDRQRRGRLERNADEVRVDRARCERSVDDGGDLAARRRRAVGQVDGADTEDAVIA